MKNTLTLSIALFFTVLFSLFLFTSCQSVPKNVPDDISEAELVQKAQECFDVGNYKGAVYYYELLVERYSDDPRNVIIGKYEIAHIYISRNKWNEAEKLLNEVLAYYNPENIDETSIALSPAYKKLAQNDINRIIEHNK